MDRKQLGACVALLAALLIPQTAQARPIETIVQDDALFLHGSEDEIRRGLERARDLGMTRVRLTAGWSVIAPTPEAAEPPEFAAADPAAYPDSNWANLDRAVRLTHAAGLRPMIDIAFWAPRWATQEPVGRGDRMATEIDPQHYARFAAAVATRYSGSWAPPARSQPQEPPPPAPDRTILDELFGRKPAPPPPPPENAEPEPLPGVDVFTIWNEPNHPGFIRPQWVKEPDGTWRVRSAEIYRAMVRAAYPQIKQAAPDATVLVGGTASMGSSTPGVSGVPPLRFLRALACVDEDLAPIATGSCAGYEPLPGDGWSHHPYSLRTTPDVDTRDQDKAPVAATARVAEVLRTLAGRGRIAPAIAELWLTEYGYETNRPDPNAPFSLEDQGRLLAWAEYIATRVPSVRSWPQFQLYDRPDEAPREGMRAFADWHSGLFFNDGSPKPAAATYATPVHVRCGRRSRRVTVWGRLRAGTPAAYELQTRKAGDWRTVSTGRAAAGEAVTVKIRHRRGRSYRLRWAGERTSAAVAPACRPKRA